MLKSWHLKCHLAINSPLDDLSLPKSLGLFRLKKENILEEDDNILNSLQATLTLPHIWHQMLFSTISWHSHPLLIIVTLTVFSWLSLSPAADCWQETHSDNSGTLTPSCGGEEMDNSRKSFLSSLNIHKYLWKFQSVVKRCATVPHYLEKTGLMHRGYEPPCTCGPAAYGRVWPPELWSHRDWRRSRSQEAATRGKVEVTRPQATNQRPVLFQVMCISQSEAKKQTILEKYPPIGGGDVLR